MQTIVAIPARYASTRLPGKPLLRETGKFLIQHVYEQASRASCADRVLVATDDSRIFEAVQSFGGEVRMTSPEHQSGTDRVAEAVYELPADIVVNVQGDEPDISPAVIDLVANSLLEDPSIPMATLGKRLSDPDEQADPNLVKVVIDRSGKALYFSRAPIPYHRDRPPSETSFLKHIGLYAYRRGFLHRFVQFPPSPLEQIERLEQLRALENGFAIKVAITEHDCIGVDTPEDYAKFVAKFRKQNAS